MKKNSLARRAKQLQLSALSLAHEMQSGPFQSFFNGNGIDLDSLSAYHRGDDVRYIDWNVLARTGKVFVKRFKETRSATILVLADMSASTHDVTEHGSIQDKIIESAALCACAAGHTNSAIGCLTFNSRLQNLLKPHNKKNYTADIFRTLENDAQQKDTNTGTALVEALQTSLQILTSRSLVIVFSDFRVTNYERELAALAAKHDVLAVRFESRHRYGLPKGGRLPFVDWETKQRVYIDTDSDERFSPEYAHMQIDYWKKVCARCGVRTLVIPSNVTPLKPLQQFFSLQKKLSLAEQGRP